MPIIKSAKKRVRTASKATVRNAKTKRAMREAIKEFQTALNSGKTEKINTARSKAVSAIDVAAKKNVIHKNKAARRKSQLNAAFKAASLKPATKSSAKKSPAKPVTAKNAAKPAAKSSVKKPAVKKPAVKK